MMKNFLTAIALFFCLVSAYGQQKDSIRFQGYDRTYLIHVPDSLSDARPVLFVTHGHGGTPGGIFKHFVKDADRYGFVLCAPQGLVEPKEPARPAWNVGYTFQEGWEVDDCAFIIALADTFKTRYGVKNVIFSGMSNGGEMCYLMAHRYPEKLTAIVSLAGLMMEWIYRSMAPSCPVPFMEVHGTADLTSKWQGDPANVDGWGKYTSVPSAVGRMISNNCCTHEVVDTLPVIRNTVVRHSYLGGTDGKDVLLYEIIGGKHSMGEKDMNLGTEMWNFCSKYFKN